MKVKKEFFYLIILDDSSNQTLKEDASKKVMVDLTLQINNSTEKDSPILPSELKVSSMLSPPRNFQSK